MLQLELDFQPHERAAVIELFDKYEPTGDILSYSISTQERGKFVAKMMFSSAKALWKVAKEWGRVQPPQQKG